MEKLKKMRSPIRSMITRTIKEAEQRMGAGGLNILTLKAYAEKFRGLTEKLESLDQQILDMILEDEEVEAEYENEYALIQDYIDNISITKLKIEKEIEDLIPMPLPSESGTLATVDGRIQKRQFKLPKIELKKFSGKLLDWLGWWAQFEKIHKDEGLHTTDKFQYLIQSMDINTRGEEIVKSYPASEENYPKVIAALQERFGKTKLLTQVYIRELFQMGLTNLNKKADVTSTYDKLVSHIRALESLKITVEQASLFLYPMVESSLPDDIMLAWQRSNLYEKDGNAEIPPKSELDYLLQFLQQEVQRAEQRTLVKSGFITTTTNNINNQDHTKKKEIHVPTAAGLFNGQTKTSFCIFCEKPHDSKDCGKTELWSLEDIKKVVQEKRVCGTCLKSGHPTVRCRTYVKCLLCSQRHYTFMCPEIKNKKIIEEKETSNSSGRINFDCSGDVLLKTIMVFVYINSDMNQKKLARLLFDDGSQRSYVTNSMTKQIRSIPIGHEYIRNILFDGTTTETQKLNNHLITISSLDEEKKMTMVLREKPILGGNVSRVPKGFWLKRLSQKGIFINDVKRNIDKSAEKIDVVIGSDYWGLIMTGNKVTLPCGLTASESIFGWTLSGVVPTESLANNGITMFMAEENLQKLWNLDVIGIRDPIEKMTEAQEEAAATKIFENTVKRDYDGRYTVRLPWKTEDPGIPSNKATALNRLVSATKRLNSKNQFKTYDDIFNTWIEEGFVEKVKEDDKNKGGQYYLPHHPVFKDSLTTPVRPVFDASWKYGRYPSLNDCLYKGANYIELLPAVLMRFRLKTVGVISDIRKAFQMINVEENDREYLKFLWWEDSTQKQIVVLRHRRVVFGLNCSPYLLAAVLKYHLKKVDASKKKISDELLKSLYVDNCVTSLDSHSGYEEFKSISTEIMADAKMELRQWESSIEQNKTLETVLTTESKVLGMVWNKSKETLCIQVPTMEVPEKLTKRSIASILHTFFDPIGYVCPALLTPKIMLQQAWRKNVSWDSDLPIVWKQQFSKWCNEAHLLKEIKIPRLCQIPNATSRQLHTFSDASQDAYATVVFLRSEYENKVEVQLVQAKNRVTPIGKASIPRLELLGCLIGSRLSASVKEAIDISDMATYFWSDSTTAIAWIQRNNEWGTFVGNRVRRILQITKEDQWRYVPGTLNPADLPSRGCTPKELLDSKWWEGPEWLKLSCEKWPNTKVEINEEEVNSERKKKSAASMFSADIQSWFKPKFSSYSENVRVMAWVRRFGNNTRNTPLLEKNKTHLTISELRDAEVDIIKIIQAEVALTPKEDKQLKRKLTASTINDHGILRLKTPISKRMDTVGFRHPYLLPRSHPFVRDLIREAHIQYCHAGTQFLMAKLREKYWITQSRKTITSVVLECVVCKKLSAKKLEVAPAVLPETRVTSGEVYDNTGVDLFGYLVLKDGTKVWVVLYTCAVYRAIHLDIINSLDIKTFIESLKRFIHLYGRPKTMMSDNATNFTGTARLLKTIDENALKMECGVNKIQWNFIPPAAPWWGGFWERMVRSVKEPMRKMLGKSVVNEDQLNEILMEIETVINDRPLTTVTEDPNDLNPLTPAMFLRGTKDATFPEEEKITKLTLQNEWKRINDYKNRLQCRFRREYLAQLVEHKKTGKASSVRIGDIVLVGADNKKRYQWPIGRVEEIMHSSDGEVRVARIKTKHGCINRALQRLYPLEMSDSSFRPDLTATLKNVPVQNSIEKWNMVNEMDTGVVVQNSLKKWDLAGKIDKANAENKSIITRSGRLVKKPCRYGQWNE